MEGQERDNSKEKENVIAVPIIPMSKNNIGIDEDHKKPIDNIKSILKGRNPLLLIIIIIVIILLIIGLIFLLGKGKNNTGNTSSSGKSDLSAEECQQNAPIYEGKVLNISGKNITGRIELSSNIEKCKIVAQYTIIVKSDLDENPINDFANLYNYVGYLNNVKMEDLKKRSSAYGTGVISPIYQNFDKFQDKYDFQTIMDLYAPGVLANGIEPTEHFLITNERWYDLSPEGYNDLLNKNIVEIIDSHDYIIKEDYNGIDTYTTDLENAELKGDIVDSFSFVVSE